MTTLNQNITNVTRCIHYNQNLFNGQLVLVAVQIIRDVLFGEEMTKSSIKNENGQKSPLGSRHTSGFDKQYWVKKIKQYFFRQNITDDFQKQLKYP